MPPDTMLTDTASPHAAGPDAARPAAGTLDHAIDAAHAALLRRQNADGHWVFELEADATIPAEYVLLKHYLGEPASTSAQEAEDRHATCAAMQSADHGGWPLFHGGRVRRVGHA